MPPRSSLTSSFSITDANNEVVCPLRNQDGSSCRKRCIGEKRYRSMQEHIRRAHPEHYISKLPATEESFLLMINTPPSERVPNQQQPSFPGSNAQGSSMLPAASAAAALAQLHGHGHGHGQGHRADQDWDSEGVRSPPLDPMIAQQWLKQSWQQQDWHSDTDGRRMPRSSIELPPIQLNDVTSDPYSSMGPNRPRDLLPSILSGSPPGRSSTLPPLHRSLGPSRPRKHSITKRGRDAQHRKQKSKGTAAEWLRRIQNDDRLRPGINDRKALSAEPSADYGKRWEDLIDAADQAASAAGDVDEDRTPVPQSPVSMHRSSLPPFSHHNIQPGNYQASPLQQALTPPLYNHEPTDSHPFPSVESGESGDNFHMESRGLSDSSPSYSSQNTQIYCAACQSVSYLKESFACTECICGLCSACVDVLMAEQGARRKCPRCATIGGRFKPFQLDIR